MDDEPGSTLQPLSLSLSLSLSISLLSLSLSLFPSSLSLSLYLPLSSCTTSGGGKVHHQSQPRTMMFPSASGLN